MNLWNKIGNNKNFGETNHILFRSTNDYGVKPGEKPITVSTEWWVWRINEKQKYVGKLSLVLKRDNLQPNITIGIQRIFARLFHCN